jgi:hypothetical protein
LREARAFGLLVTLSVAFRPDSVERIESKCFFGWVCLWIVTFELSLFPDFVAMKRRRFGTVGHWEVQCICFPDTVRDLNGLVFDFEHLDIELD